MKSFYVPRSHPDGFSVNVHCLDEATVAGVNVTPFDGELGAECLQTVADKRLIYLTFGWKDRKRLSYSCRIMKRLIGIAWFRRLLLASTACAEPAWVSDQFEITLRSGPSTSNAIQLMVDSGTRLEVLERDAEAGYTRVRTQGGTEGWVLTRYLMNEASAREQLETLTSQLTNANTRGSSLDSQLAAIKGEYDSASRQIATLEREKAAVEKELAEIKRTAANVLAINDQNKSLDGPARGGTDSRGYAGAGKPGAGRPDDALLVYVRRAACCWSASSWDLAAANSLAASLTLRPFLRHADSAFRRPGTSRFRRPCRD